MPMPVAGAAAESRLRHTAAAKQGRRCRSARGEMHREKGAARRAYRKKVSKLVHPGMTFYRLESLDEADPEYKYYLAFMRGLEVRDLLIARGRVSATGFDEKRWHECPLPCGCRSLCCQCHCAAPRSE